MKRMLWAEASELCAEDLSDMLQPLRIDMIFQAVSMREDKPAVLTLACSVIGQGPLPDS